MRATLSALTIIFISCVVVSCGQGPQRTSVGPGDSETTKDKLSSICSILSFTGVEWPTSFSELHRLGFALSLNITGSFEAVGSVPVWNTISDDFDGQGMSLGLFQQNFGQGTLQPLLIEMIAQHESVMKHIFSAEHFKSLSAMLQSYQKKQSQMTMQMNFSILSPLDKNSSEESFKVRALQDSVSWARENLYVNGKFVPSWKREFVSMAESPEYISLQIRTAQSYHSKALEYFEELKFSQTRAYLMLVDVVVQNGGLYTQDIIDYAEYLKQSPVSSEADRLLTLMELRIRHVRPRFVDDVRRRKTTIIKGAGVVHGKARELEKEYCYQGRAAFL